MNQQVVLKGVLTKTGESGKGVQLVIEAGRDADLNALGLLIEREAMITFDPLPELLDPNQNEQAERPDPAPPASAESDQAPAPPARPARPRPKRRPKPAPENEAANE